MIATSGPPIGEQPAAVDWVSQQSVGCSAARLVCSSGRSSCRLNEQQSVGFHFHRSAEANSRKHENLVHFLPIHLVQFSSVAHFFSFLLLLLLRAVPLCVDPSPIVRRRRRRRPSSAVILCASVRQNQQRQCQPPLSSASVRASVESSQLAPVDPLGVAAPPAERTIHWSSLSLAAHSAQTGAPDRSDRGLIYGFLLSTLHC